MPTENEKQLTAMMMLIEKIKKDRDYSLPIKKYLIKKIEAHLPTERQQLIDFYEASSKINPKTKVSNCHSISGESWYDLTFKTQ